VIVNEFMSSIVSTNAEGRLLESAEERRGEEQRSRITQLIVVANYEMRWTRQTTARERTFCAVILRC